MPTDVVILLLGLLVFGFLAFCKKYGMPSTWKGEIESETFAQNLEKMRRAKMDYIEKTHDAWRDIIRNPIYQKVENICDKKFLFKKPVTKEEEKEYKEFLPYFETLRIEEMYQECKLCHFINKDSVSEYRMSCLKDYVR